MLNWIKAHRHALAYTVVAVACAFSVGSVQKSSNDQGRIVTEQRLQIVQSGTRAVANGCDRDYKTATKVRSALGGRISDIEDHFKDGKVTATELEDYKNGLNAVIDSIEVPDCKAEIANFLKRIE